MDDSLCVAVLSHMNIIEVIREVSRLESRPFSIVHIIRSVLEPRQTLGKSTSQKYFLWSSGLQIQFREKSL